MIHFLGLLHTMCFLNEFLGFHVFMFSGFWVFGFFLDAKKYEKKLNGNCSSKKICSTLGRKKHENMNPPPKKKLTQKPKNLC